jgi:hypothetical protein
MQIPLEFNTLKTKLMASRVPCEFLVVAFVQLNDPIAREGSLPVSGDGGTDVSIADTRTEKFVHGSCVVLPIRRQGASVRNKPVQTI